MRRWKYLRTQILHGYSAERYLWFLFLALLPLAKMAKKVCAVHSQDELWCRKTLVNVEQASEQ